MTFSAAAGGAIAASPANVVGALRSDESGIKLGTDQFKGVIDLARAMKDLNGYNPASSIKLDAILCAPGQVSTINGLLGREVTDTGARQVDLRIDATLQGAAVIPMSR